MVNQIGINRTEIALPIKHIITKMPIKKNKHM